MNENEYLKAWDAYISDSDEMFTQEEYLAFKNGWCCAMSYIQTIGRSCWNDAAFPESRYKHPKTTDWYLPIP